VTFDAGPCLLAKADDRAFEDCLAIRALDQAGFEQWLQTAPPSSRAWVERHQFRPQKGAVLMLPGATDFAPVILVGLGEAGSLQGPDPWGWALVAERLPPGCYFIDGDMPPQAQMMAGLGWALAHYRYDPYLQNQPDRPLRQLIIPDAKARIAAIRDAKAIALVRDLINSPANDMLPGDLERVARDLAKSWSADIEVICGEQLLAQNFPTIHAVGRASSDAPRLIDIRWGSPDAPRLTLVGKGVCFDSGGLDIKPASGMRLMKKDMGGAAHVLGLAQRIIDDDLPVRLRVLIPAVENAIAGNAFRPGDILRTRKGLSVEIGNTDAEGRLVLCDALAWACEEKPDLLLDFATLTGAARVALGPDLPALFTADHALAESYAKAAIHTGDPLWRLPLWDAYLEYLDSSIADIANAGDSPFAGAITAALYLSRFIEKGQCWAHFDVYAWAQKPRPGRPMGGEAMALRASFEVIKNRYTAS
jgi:leucyl aminopeptidase